MDALTEREADAVSTAIDGYADIIYDAASTPEEVGQIIALATAARKLGLTGTADHWDGKVTELCTELGFTLEEATPNG